MKTIIIIFTPLGLEENIPEIKNRIVRYLGNRLIKENPDNAPLLELNSTIDKVDKDMVSELTRQVLDTAVLVVIETDDDQFGKASGNMCVVQPVMYG